MNSFRWISMVLLVALLLAACSSGSGTPTATAPMETTGTEPTQAAGATTAAPTGAQQLTVLTHDSFAVSEDLIAEFESLNNVSLSFIKGGDAGSVINRAILTKANPTADVLYGLDNTFLSRGLEEDLFEPYASPLLEGIAGDYKLDPENRVLPVDYGDVCINYDKGYFADNNLSVPASLDDLLKPEYNGLLVTENPATSSPGLAFLLATIAQYGEDGYLEYWQQLRENGVVVAQDWEAAYYTNFSGSSGRGPQPMVVSYASSPAAEVVFADPPVDEAPTASIVAPGTCFRQVELVGILKGTPNRALAEKFVDFMLSVPFQEDMPLQMFVFPVNPEAALPEVYVEHVQQPAQPATLDAGLISTKRNAWIQAWTETVLR